MKDRRRLCIDVIQLLNVEKTNKSSQTTHIHSVFIKFTYISYLTKNFYSFTKLL